MGKNKLEKFADMASYPHVFEYPYSAVDNAEDGDIIVLAAKGHEDYQ